MGNGEILTASKLTVGANLKRRSDKFYMNLISIWQNSDWLVRWWLFSLELQGLNIIHTISSCCLFAEFSNYSCCWTNMKTIGKNCKIILQTGNCFYLKILTYKNSKFMKLPKEMQDTEYTTTKLEEKEQFKLWVLSRWL